MKPVINIPKEIKTKAELFDTIRKLTNEGYFFEIRNYFETNGRSAYMVEVLSHKSE